MIKKNYLNLIIKIFFNFTSLIICAALASFLASMIFIFAVGLIKYGDIINWSQFNWGQIIIVGIGGSVMGPVLASPFLCFFMMPWIFFMQSKKITKNRVTQRKQFNFQEVRGTKSGRYSQIQCGVENSKYGRFTPKSNRLRPKYSFNECFLN